MNATQKIAKFAVTAIAAAGLGAAAFAGAGTASASTADSQFIDAIAKIGISYDTPKDAIFDGHLVCSKLDDGTDPDDIVASYREVPYLDAPSLKQAQGFVVAAATAYCPEYIA
jgi:hypothetical protein